MSTSTRTFVPPQFASFGKNAKDLFKKKFDYDHQLKTIHKAKNGLTLESGGVIPADKSSFRGYSKASLVQPQWGSADLEIHTSENQESKASVKFTKLYPGANVNLAVSSKDSTKFFPSQSGSAEVSYTQAGKVGVAAQSTIKSDLNKYKEEVQVAFGYENFSVGANATIDLTQVSNADKNYGVTESNFGAEYVQDDLVATGYTSFENVTTSEGKKEKNRFVNASYFQKVNRDHVFGVLFKFNVNRYQQSSKPVTDKTSFASVQLGWDYRLDVDTGLKAKVELPAGTAAVAIEHRLANPSALVGLAAEFSLTNTNVSAEKFGASLTLGDF